MIKADRNFSLIIFGASGSLAKLKIFPSLYELALEGRMPDDYAIVGYSRSDRSDDQFRATISKSVRAANESVDDKVLEDLCSRAYYVDGQYDELSGFEKLSERLSEVEADKDRVRLAYFSVPPFLFEDIIKLLADTLGKEEIDLRLILEKPFGDDYESSKELKRILLSRFKKEKVFLLDHYLGKEALFNLMSLRYANSIFSYLIKGEYINNIQITALESVDIEGRAGYFEGVGTLKDMVQSHLFQMLIFLTMYIPRNFTSDLVHKSKVHLLENMYFDGNPENIVRGQYGNYRSHEGVNKDSMTETFVAMKMGIDSTNWHGVPIYLRSGKCLKNKWTSVVIEFKPHQYQKNLDGHVEPNKLVIELQPNEKIEFYLLTKQGGRELLFEELSTSRPIYCSGDCLSEHARLLLEVIKGDQLFFLDFPEIYEAWKIIDPITDMFKGDEVPLEMYDCGGVGPEAADKLLEKDGFKWHNFL